MKSLITLTMILASVSSFASPETNLGNKCLKKVKRHYYQNGQRSDIPLRIEFDQFLSAGTPLKGFQDKKIVVFDEDKLIYSISGSYYSGWFNDVSVVNPTTCETEEIINIYSE